MPNIIVQYHPNSDYEQFCKLLYDQDFLAKRPHAKHALLYNFPDLSNLLKEGNTLDIIQSFVQKLYDQHQTQLIDIQQETQKHFVDIQETLFYGLEHGMQYSFPPEKQYFVTLSFWPYSTYTSQWATITVLGIIRGVTGNEIVDIFVHEMTHTIFTEKMEQQKWQKLQNVWYQFLKEIIAPIVIRNVCFENIITHASYKEPNPEQYFINVESQGALLSLTDFFDMLYKSVWENGRAFDTFLTQAIEIMVSIQEELKQKQQIFFSLCQSFQPGSEAFTQQMRQSTYGVPIKI